VLQEGLNEDLEYQYRLNFYGPFSQDLANNLSALHDMGLINVEYREDTGKHHVEITDSGKKFLRKFEAYGSSKLKVNKVTSMTEEGQDEKADLVANVLYFAKLTDDDQEVKKLVNVVKPRFSDDEIEEALKKIREEKMVHFQKNKYLISQKAQSKEPL
jgi:uncharacterized protein YwgA